MKKLSLFNNFDEIETDVMPENNLRLTRRNEKIAFRKIEQKKNAIEHLLPLPEENESIHMVTNARFDFYDFIPAIIEICQCNCLNLTAATWIMNRTNINNMFDLFDSGKINSINFLVGIYFKRRETGNYTTMSEGLMNRRQKFKAGLNHSKFLSMEMSNGNCYTIESSANMTENGNIETHVLTNSKELHNFHKEWMTKILK